LAGDVSGCNYTQMNLRILRFLFPLNSKGYFKTGKDSPALLLLNKYIPIAAVWFEKVRRDEV